MASITAGENGNGNGLHEDDPTEEDPELDITINNVVCSFSVRCHLNLREIALHGLNVEYKKENGMVTMKLRRPYTTASMWSSGKVTCTGANSEEQAKVAARRYARVLQKLGFDTHFRNYRVVNVLGTCTMPWAIKITQFSQEHKNCASYEPELHPGVTYKLKTPSCKATLKIFSTGSITITAPSVDNVRKAVEHIYDLVRPFRKAKTKQDEVRDRELTKNGEKTFVKRKNENKKNFSSSGSKSKRAKRDEGESDSSLADSDSSEND